MKIVLTLIHVAMVLITLAQEQENYNGLNRYIPDKTCFGMKAQSFVSSPLYRIDDRLAGSGAIEAENLRGGALGFFFRYDFNDHLALQSEINVHLSHGVFRTKQLFIQDTILGVSIDELTKYYALSIEIPLYLKWRWKITQLYKGHYKPRSAIGLYMGPRFVLTPHSKRNIDRLTTTILYDQVSRNLQLDVPDIARQFAPSAYIGAAVGCDFELWNGLMFHIAYFRGLFSHALESNGYSAIDNRLEMGIGLRFK
ncbi:PorT family protein [Crocinitomicaceae bacterium]|nr:PorT family protein [Crocinitomicaceae bacterium]